MIIKSLLCKTCSWIFFICLCPATVHAATITQQESWSLFSGPNDATVQEMRSIDTFDPSLGTLTQVEWVVDASIAASFFVAPSSFPIQYSFGAGIGCGVAIPLAGTFGCDLGVSPVRSDSRVGGTLPIGGPTGISQIIPLAYVGAFSFTDPTAELPIFTGTTPIGLSLLVDTSAQAQSCFPDPFGSGEICTDLAVGYFGDYTGTLTVTYTFDPVPIPSAVWLFGSGLIGLIGIARRKKS